MMNITINQYNDRSRRSPYSRRQNRRPMPMTEGRYQVVQQGMEVFHMVSLDRDSEYRTEEEAYAALTEHLVRNKGMLDPGTRYAVIRVCCVAEV